jgi:hypothetical protein
VKRAILLLVLAACPSKTSPTTTGSGTGSDATGSGSGTVNVPPDPSIKSCDNAKQKVADLYRAEGMTGKDAKRIDAFVEDNTTMVMADCAKQPDKVVPCLASAKSVADIETRCLEQLDDEGTEGDRLRK